MRAPWRLDGLRHEGGLVELHPLRSDSGQRGQQLCIDGQQVVEAVDRREAGGAALSCLGEQQEGDRADDDRARAVSTRGGLGDLANEAVRREVKVGVGADLWHEVVVVRVEPLGHLGGHVVALAAGDGEVAGEVDGAVVVHEALKTRRHGADGDRRVEHLVVEAESLGDAAVGAPETELYQALARHRAQLGCGGLELIGAELSGPESLDGLLQLAAAADARVAEDRSSGECGSHAFSFSSSPTPRSTASTGSCWLNV
jgi:hypothetical protein